MDMITLARNRACDDIVLLSGDADLVVGVLQAQEHGVRVHLLGVAPARGNQAPTLRQESDTCHEWNTEVIGRFLRAATAEEVVARTTRPSPRTTRSIPASGAVHAPPSAPWAHGSGGDDNPSVVPGGVPSPAVETASPALVRADLVAAMPAGISEALLRTVAEALARDLHGDERDEILRSPRPGIVPGHIDRRLLGTAKAMFNTLLQEPEKRVLRRLLFEVCAARARDAEIRRAATPLDSDAGHAR